MKDLPKGKYFIETSRLDKNRFGQISEYILGASIAGGFAVGMGLKLFLGDHPNFSEDSGVLSMFGGAFAGVFMLIGLDDYGRRINDKYNKVMEVATKIKDHTTNFLENKN